MIVLLFCLLVARIVLKGINYITLAQNFAVDLLPPIFQTDFFLFANPRWGTSKGFENTYINDKLQVFDII